jgi:hypothetical protein
MDCTWMGIGKGTRFAAELELRLYIRIMVVASFITVNLCLIQGQFPESPVALPIHYHPPGHVSIIVPTAAEKEILSHIIMDPIMTPQKAVASLTSTPSLFKDFIRVTL